MEFPGVKEIPSMWNFQGSLFLVLKFPRDLTQFCGIFRGWALLCLDFPGVTKVKKNEKFQGVGGFKKYIFNPPPSLRLELEENSQGWQLRKTHVEFPWILLLGFWPRLGISKGCYTISDFADFRGEWKLFSGLSKKYSYISSINPQSSLSLFVFFPGIGIAQFPPRGRLVHIF